MHHSFIFVFVAVVVVVVVVAVVVVENYPMKLPYGIYMAL